MDLERQADPRAAARQHRERVVDRDEVRLLRIRAMLDRLTPDQVVWMPWRRAGIDLDFDGPHRVYRYRCLLACGPILEPYHPDHLLRQFGRVQTIPDPPIWPTSDQWADSSRSYSISFPDSAPTLDDRLDHLIDLDQHAVARRGWEVDQAYIDWFRDRTHPIVDPRSVPGLLPHTTFADHPPAPVQPPALVQPPVPGPPPVQRQWVPPSVVIEHAPWPDMGSIGPTHISDDEWAFLTQLADTLSGKSPAVEDPFPLASQIRSDRGEGSGNGHEPDDGGDGPVHGDAQ